MSIERIKNIIKYNSHNNPEGEEKNKSLFCLKSLINHSCEPNLKLEFI